MLMTKEIKLMQKIVRSMKKIVIEPVFRIQEDCLFFNFIDNSGVTNIQLKIFKKFFSKYEYRKNLYIKVNFVFLDKIMAKAKEGDSLFISFDDNENPARMKITLTNERRKKEYELPLIETNEKDMAVYNKDLNMQYDYKVIMGTEDIIEVIESMIFNTEKLVLEVDKDNIKLKESDVTKGKSSFTLKDFDEKGLKQSIKVKVNVLLFKNIVEFSNVIAEKSMFSVRTDYPLQIVTVTPECELKSILAPLVEND